jgi:probable F420-dependent oxidoreductase
MQLGKYAAWFSLEGGSLAQAVEAAQRVEALGYSALWQPIALQRDIMVTASLQLAATKRLVIATGIATIYERAPLIMAAAQRALGEQSGDRFLLGLGCSHAPIVRPLFDRDYEKPLEATRNYLDRMDAGVAFPGMPASTPKQAGPRVLAALGPKMLALSRDRAQGAHPYFMPPEHTKLAREILGPDRWLCPEVKVIFETNPKKARDLGRKAGATNIALANYQREWRNLGFSDADFANGGSDRLIDATVAWGDEAQVRKFLDRHFAAGATQVCIHPVGEAAGAAGPVWEILEALAAKR